jgi:hypothetical protein
MRRMWLLVSLFFLISLLLIFLQACTTSNTITTETSKSSVSKTFSEFITATSVKTPTVVIISSPMNNKTIQVTKHIEPSKVPTLSETVSKMKVKELIETNGGCKLPCIWGVVPGQSTPNLAKDFLSSLGWNGKDFLKPQGSVFYSGKDIDDSLLLDYAFFEDQNKVKIVAFSYIDKRDPKAINTFYTIKNVLIALGVPSQIWLNIAVGGEVQTPDSTGFDLYLYFEKQVVLLKYGGLATKKGDYYYFCPTNASYNANREIFDPQIANISVQIYAGDPTVNQSPQMLTEPFGKFEGKVRSVEAFNMDESVFYNETTSNENIICLRTPVRLWQ